MNSDTYPAQPMDPATLFVWDMLRGEGKQLSSAMRAANNTWIWKYNTRDMMGDVHCIARELEKRLYTFVPAHLDDNPDLPEHRQLLHANQRAINQFFSKSVDWLAIAEVAWQIGYDAKFQKEDQDTITNLSRHYAEMIRDREEIPFKLRYSVAESAYRLHLEMCGNDEPAVPDLLSHMANALMKFEDATNYHRNITILELVDFDLVANMICADIRSREGG